MTVAILERSAHKELPLSYPWLATLAAAQYLGRPRGWVQDHCKNGPWELGVHFRFTNKINATLPRYQVNVERVAEWMSTPMDQR